MTRMSLALGIALVWLSTAGVRGADFGTGCAAFDRGDYERARAEWESLADRGHAQAQFRLGCLYTFGHGVPEDHAMALRLYRLAAEQGDADAQNNLGGAYAEGLGVEPDLVEAFMWLELAASQGHQTALRNQAFLADRMSGEQIALARTRAAAWRQAHR